MPATLPQLTKPLHLDDPLNPKRDPFDIFRDPVGKSKDRVLRSKYPAHSYAHSSDPHASFTSVPLPRTAYGGSTSRYIRLEYQMLFQPGFKWVKGGKLPGILVGTEQGCNGACSGGGSAENCFSTRMMWRAQGEGELYLYAAKSLKITPGSKNMCNPVYGISIGRGGSFKFKSGVWHNITQIVRINSKGKAVRDGYLGVYLDGLRVIEAENLVLLKKGYDSSLSATNHDVKFMFSSFFGGSTKDYATPTAQWIAWKGFKMETSVKNIWN
ncbi:hypothetical protein B0O80DRAFT_391639 [Mortierella sp. GBAus27b]|nr:hypothetical protein B0O80DRAFT_391639 [Mortierella sp. GBAus27b]